LDAVAVYLSRQAGPLRCWDHSHGGERLPTDHSCHAYVQLTAHKHTLPDAPHGYGAQAQSPISCIRTRPPLAEPQEPDRIASGWSMLDYVLYRWWMVSGRMLGEGFLGCLVSPCYRNHPCRCWRKLPASSLCVLSLLKAESSSSSPRLRVDADAPPEAAGGAVVASSVPRT